MEKPRLTLQQGREVRRLRAKGLKLWEVAATIGCSRATVTRVLAGPGNLESRQFEWMPGPLRLSVAELEEISLGLKGGESLGSVARPRRSAEKSRTTAAVGTTGPCGRTMEHMNERVSRRRASSAPGHCAIRSPRGCKRGGRQRRSRDGSGSSSRRTRACT
jgi:hypothetical protein